MATSGATSMFSTVPQALVAEAACVGTDLVSGAVFRLGDMDRLSSLHLHESDIRAVWRSGYWQVPQQSGTGVSMFRRGLKSVSGASEKPPCSL